MKHCFLLLFAIPQLMLGQIIKDYPKAKIHTEGLSKDEIFQKLKETKPEDIPAPIITPIQELEETFIQIWIDTDAHDNWGFGDDPEYPSGFCVHIRRKNGKEYRVFESNNRHKIYCREIERYDYTRPNIIKKLKKAREVALLQALNDFASWGFEPWSELGDIGLIEDKFQVGTGVIWMKKVR